MSLLGWLTGSDDQAAAAKKAAEIQAASAQQGMDYIKRLLSPFIKTGTAALGAQGDMLGLGKPGSEQIAIDNIANSPFYLDAVKQGENSILSNASATGGLRGGNTEAALAQFSPQLLNQFIQQRFQNLGGLSGFGLNAGTNAGNSVANLYGQQGAAQAGGVIAAGNQQANDFGSLASLAGLFLGSGGIPGIKKSMGF